MGGVAMRGSYCHILAIKTGTHFHRFVGKIIYKGEKYVGTFIFIWLFKRLFSRMQQLDIWLRGRAWTLNLVLEVLFDFPRGRNCRLAYLNGLGAGNPLKVILLVSRLFPNCSRRFLETLIWHTQTFK